MSDINAEPRSQMDQNRYPGNDMCNFAMDIRWKARYQFKSNFEMPAARKIPYRWLDLFYIYSILNETKIGRPLGLFTSTSLILIKCNLCRSCGTIPLFPYSCNESTKTFRIHRRWRFAKSNGAFGTIRNIIDRILRLKLLPFSPLFLS